MLLGASPLSLNGGVAALGTACIDQLTSAIPNARILVVAGGINEQIELELPDRIVPLEVCWVNSLRSFRIRSSCAHLEFLRRLRWIMPGLGTAWFPNRTLKQIMSCDAVLDIGAGDSFSDIYGSGVFERQVAVKQLAIDMRKPLILLPQTYGPFSLASSRKIAKLLLAQSALVATRELRGLDELRTLMNEELDDRFSLCPDIAFALRPTTLPKNSFSMPSGNGPLVGINISGLLWKNNVDLKLASDYQELCRRLIAWVMDIPDAKLLLVPHVFNKRNSLVTPSSQGLYEDSDLDLCSELAAETQERWGSRISTLTHPYSASQLKTIIGGCDFFIGARMHACIAGISQAVPTITLAYSKKAAGVMGVAGVDELVVDLREQDLKNVLHRVETAFANRQAWRQQLKIKIPAVHAAVQTFFAERISQKLMSLKYVNQNSKRYVSYK